MENFLITLILTLVLFLSAKSTYAYVRVRGYFRKSTGTYVMPHFRSNPMVYDLIIGRIKEITILLL